MTNFTKPYKESYLPSKDEEYTIEIWNNYVSKHINKKRPCFKFESMPLTYKSPYMCLKYHYLYCVLQEILLSC